MIDALRGISPKDLKFVARDLNPPQPSLEELRAFYEGGIRMYALRLQGGERLSMDRSMRDIMRGDMEVPLSGIYRTLLGPNGETYARTAIGWAVKNAENQGIQLDPAVLRTAQVYSVAR